MDEVELDIGNKFGPFYLLVCLHQLVAYAYECATISSGVFMNLVPYNCTAIDNNTSDGYADLSSWRTQGFVSGLSVQYKLCDNTLAEFTSICFFIGSIFGALLSGFVSDLIGRIPTISICLAMSGLANLSAALVPNFWLHIGVRLMKGIFISAATTVHWVYGCEVVPFRLRPIMMGFLGFGGAVGFSNVPAIGYITKHHQTFQITLAAISCAPLILTVLLPESPRWLAQRRRWKAVNRSIDRMRCLNCTSTAQVPSSSQHYEPPDTTSTSLGLIDSFVLLLKHKKLMIRGVVISSYLFGAGVSFYGCCFIVSQIVTNLYIYSLLFGLVQIPYCFVANIFSRRVTLMVSGLISGLLTLTIAVVVLVRPDYIEVTSLSVLNTVLGALATLFSTISFNVGVIVAAETYPTVVRNTCTGISISIMRIGCVLAPAAAFIPPLPVRLLVLSLPLMVSSCCAIVLPDTRRMELVDAVLPTAGAEQKMEELTEAEQEEMLKKVENEICLNNI